MLNAKDRNLFLFFILVVFVLISRNHLQFHTPIGGVMIAIILYFQAELIRKSALFDMVGLVSIDSMTEIFESKKNMKSFLIRKSTWIIIPLTYVLLNPNANIRDLGLIPAFTGFRQLVPFTILILFSSLMFFDAKRSMDVSLKGYLKSFTTSLIAAGFPEDLVIIGLIGGRVYILMLTFFSPRLAKVLSVLIVESLFCLSHIPAVHRAKELYSKHMTMRDNMSYTRMFIQMFIVSLPGWVFYFISSHIYFSIWWHSLADIAIFLPKQNLDKEESIPG